MLLFSFVGLLLLRLDEAKLLELLFQLPPRKPRDELARWARTPVFLPPGQNRAAKSVALRMTGMGHPRTDALRYPRRLAPAASARGAQPRQKPARPKAFECILFAATWLTKRSAAGW